MAQIAVTIVDSKNNRSAHLVDTQTVVRDLIPPIVASLKWPKGASYQLFGPGSDSALPADKTLAQLGIPAGAELMIRPIRNQVLKVILEKLYEEAHGYIEDQAWELAKAKLELLFLLDPLYPDRLELQKAVAAHFAPPLSTPPSEEFISRQPTTASGTVTTTTPASGPSASGPFAATPLPAASREGAYQLTPEVANSSGSGCVGTVLMILGVIAAGVIAVVGTRTFFPDLLNDLSARMGVAFPGSIVLGTGDVQVTLRWEGEADIDLAVVDPTGERIWFSAPESTSGGVLDVDANGACEGVNSPVENIYWPTGDAPAGEYLVLVSYFQECGYAGPVDYEVTITLDGDVVDVINAQITATGEEHPVTNFRY